MLKKKVSKLTNQTEENQKLLDKINKEQKVNPDMINKNFKLVKRPELEEVAERLTPIEVFLVMFSVAIGVGYVQLSNFYIKHPEFFVYPISAVVFNVVFGIVSIYLLVDAYKLKRRLGSF